MDMFKHVNENIQGFVRAARLCLRNDLVLPCVALIYSTIDQLAYLDRAPEHEDVRGEDFIRWVDTYLLPGSGLNCSAIDIYGARCGMLHSQSPQSKLSRQGKAKQLCYARGETTREEFQAFADRFGYDAIAVHPKRLLEALIVAENRFGTHINETPEKAWLVAERASVLFAEVLPEEMV